MPTGGGARGLRGRGPRAAGACQVHLRPDAPAADACRPAARLQPLPPTPACAQPSHPPSKLLCTHTGRHHLRLHHINADGDTLECQHLFLSGTVLVCHRHQECAQGIASIFWTLHAHVQHKQQCLEAPAGCAGRRQPCWERRGYHTHSRGRVRGIDIREGRPAAQHRAAHCRGLSATWCRRFPALCPFWAPRHRQDCHPGGVRTTGMHASISGDPHSCGSSLHCLIASSGTSSE